MAGERPRRNLQPSLKRSFHSHCGGGPAGLRPFPKMAKVDSLLLIHRRRLLVTVVAAVGSGTSRCPRERHGARAPTL